MKTFAGRKFSRHWRCSQAHALTHGADGYVCYNQDCAMSSSGRKISALLRPPAHRADALLGSVARPLALVASRPLASSLAHAPCTLVQSVSGDL